MKILLTATATIMALAAPVFAEGDVEKGKKAFKKCKSCHKIESPEGEMIVKGGKTGPNLWGVIGRAAGSTDFKYGKTLKKLGEDGLVWDVDNIQPYMTDAKAFLKEKSGDAKAKSKMSFKMKKDQEHVAAFLASHSPVPEPVAEEGAAEATTAEEGTTASE